jgi:hypothetical protein
MTQSGHQPELRLTAHKIQTLVHFLA